MKPKTFDSRSTVGHRGFSLVELLVAVAIGLVLTLILTSMIARQEGLRRTTTNTNDVATSGAYASYVLDRELRSAGTGFSQGWVNTVGCVLSAARNGTQILPRPTAFPVPFNNLPRNVQLAPVLIHAGMGAGGSDVLAVAAGSSGLGETVLSMLPGSATLGQIRLANTLGLRGGDLILLAEATKGCMLQQVNSPFTGGATQPLNFGGTYALDTIGTLALTSFGTSNNTFVANIGNVTGNTPRLQFIGLGNNSTLFTYDVLNLNGLDMPQPLVEGVVDIRAVYGVGNANGVLTSWAAPTAGTAFGIGALTDGTTTAQATLRSIVAVRVGMVLRSDLVEKETVNTTSVSMFSDLPGGLTYTYNVPAGQERQRFRVVEFTVPLRNVLLTY